MGQNAYNNNYKGKNPMTKTQWRRFQCQKTAEAVKNVGNSDKGKGKQIATVKMARKPATERIFLPLSIVKEGLTLADEEMTSNFSKSESSALFAMLYLSFQSNTT
jgi:hypothetical protein